MRIDVYGPAKCNYFVAKAAAKSVLYVARQFFSPVGEIRTHGNNVFSNAIKSELQNSDTLWSQMTAETVEAEIYWYSHTWSYHYLPFMDQRPALALVRDRIVDCFNISSAKFCQVYGWKPGDVVEYADEGTLLRIDGIDHESGRVYGGRCNSMQQDFSDQQEIFPDYRFVKVEL